MKIGYARVSSEDQNLDRQIEALEQQGCEQIFTEKLSGKNRERPALEDAIKYARKGDEVVFLSLDRMARSTRDAVEIVQEIRDKGASVRIIAENLNLSHEEDLYSDLIFHVMSAFAEFERKQIKKRQREGIEIAKAKGTYAKPRKLTPEVISAAHRKVAAGIPKARIARDLNISRASLYRALGDQSGKEQAA